VWPVVQRHGRQGAESCARFEMGMLGDKPTGQSRPYKSFKPPALLRISLAPPSAISTTIESEMGMDPYSYARTPTYIHTVYIPYICSSIEDQMYDGDYHVIVMMATHA